MGSKLYGKLLIKNLGTHLPHENGSFVIAFA